MVVRRLLINLSPCVFSTVIALFIAEIGLRIFYPQRLGVWYNTRDGMVMHWPNLRTHRVNGRKEVQINSLGMRDREHNVKRKGDTFRILLLGDSFMEAFQVSFEESFTKPLARCLQQSTDQVVEVINAAVSGWGSDDQLAYLNRYGVEFKPDLILVAMTLHNDVSDNLRERYHIIVGEKLLARPVRDRGVFEYMIVQIKDFIAAHSHLYQLYRKY